MPTRHESDSMIIFDGLIQACEGVGLTPRTANPNAGRANELTTLWMHNDNGIHRPTLGPQHLALFLRAAKSGDTARSSATLELDPDLVVSVAAGRRYIIEARLRFNESVATCGFNCGLNGTATVTDYDCSYEDAAIAGALNYTAEFTNLTDTRNHASALGGDGLVMLHGNLIVNAAGTFGVRWARASATTGTATLRKGSWLKLTEVA